MSFNVHSIGFGSEYNNYIVKFMGLVWKEIIFGGHLFATGSVSVIMACATVFMIPVSLDILFVSYLLFYAIYLYDYSAGASSDELTNEGRARYLQCKSRSKCIVFIVSVILFLALLIFANTITTLIGLSILVLGLLYGSHFKKLTKKIPAFKNIFVSMVWSFLALFLFVYYSLPITYGALMLALFIFIRMVNIQILFDVRDVEGDIAAGLLTIPALFGERKYLLILRLINFVSILFVLVCVIQGLLPFFTLAIMPMFYYAVTYIDKVVKSRKNYSSYVFAACEPIMWALLIFAGRSISMLNIMF
ncbi:UbiA family prenyltransferase [Methanolobus mangrovi]|uniref:UbiA family prenyltransferase n=1 Tax=Methanolobus mangrovi TaxID=3072977 RepID=A0AA51UHK1_9EURY|nr:UbiA family prenyltransferase [Methanolobus mangrovi]WMW23108.1 UbiA family prenyltransferase [Methanolobus mangrovi]